MFLSQTVGMVLGTGTQAYWWISPSKGTACSHFNVYFHRVVHSTVNNTTVYREIFSKYIIYLIFQLSKACRIGETLITGVTLLQKTKPGGQVS